MQRYAIVERGDEASARLSKKLRKDLDAFLTYDEVHPELVISVGGDGTMLRSVHDYIDQLEEVAFVGIHTGTLGFFTDYTIDEANLLVYDIKDKALTVEKRSMIEAMVSVSRHHQVLRHTINPSMAQSWHLVQNLCRSVK